jgi:hypothetical protein
VIGQRILQTDEATRKLRYADFPLRDGLALPAGAVSSVVPEQEAPMSYLPRATPGSGFGCVRTRTEHVTLPAHCAPDWA